METVNVELTFDELAILIDSMMWAEKSPEHAEKVGEASFKKLFSRLNTIDKAHTVMLTAAMHDDNPEPFDWASFANID